VDYLTVKEIGEKWGITSRMGNYHCSAGRISRVVKKAGLWLSPADAKNEVKIFLLKQGSIYARI
jgi:hypothetical protein